MYRLGLIVLILASVAAFPQVAATEDSGSATGVVLDADGKPLAGATVYALPKENMTKQIRTITDAAGRFMLTGLPNGGAYIDAYKESDGYPYSLFSFFKTPGDRTPVELTISAGATTTHTVLRLGPRAAYLDINVADEDGTAVSGNLSFDRTDIPGP